MKVTLEMLDDEIAISKSENGFYITVKRPPSFDKNYPFDYVYLHKNYDIDSYCGGANFFNTFEEAAQFLITLRKAITPNFIEVKLNNSYTAKVYKDKIEVGCQTFPVSIIDDLYKAHSGIC